MFPSSAIQVVERGPSRLVITDPPYYVVGWGFVLTGLLVVGFVLLRGGRLTSVDSSRWFSTLAAVPFLLVGLMSLTSAKTTTFSRDSQTMIVESQRFIVARRKTEIPLGDIHSATVETGTNTRRLVVVLDSGRVINLTGLTDQQGQYAAASAINDFLVTHQGG